VRRTVDVRATPDILGAIGVPDLRPLRHPMGRAATVRRPGARWFRQRRLDRLGRRRHAPARRAPGLGAGADPGLFGIGTARLASPRLPVEPRMNSRAVGQSFRAGTDRLNRNGPRFRYRLLWPPGRPLVRKGGRRRQDGHQPRKTDRRDEPDRGPQTP
jgi:hypothetical protein